MKEVWKERGKKTSVMITWAININQQRLNYYRKKIKRIHMIF